MTGPLTALNLAFVNYFTFKGRATRAEFWWVTLAYTLVGGALLALDYLAINPYIVAQDFATLASFGFFDFYYSTFAVLTAIPYITLSVRRLHDVGLSGFWWFLSVIPFVGTLALIFLYCLPSNSQTSNHGTPKTPPTSTSSGKRAPQDAHKRAMQGYALLFDKDKLPSPETQAARKAEIGEYYRSQVLKSAPST